MLLAQLVVYDANGTNQPVAPAGWNLIRHDSTSNGNQITSWLYDKVAGTMEPASYTWTIAPQYAAGVMGAWRGASASPIDQSSGATTNSGNPSVAAAPSLTPSTDNELQVYFYGSQNNLAPTIMESEALAPRANDPSTKEGFTIAYGDLAAPSAGTPSATYPASASASRGFPVLTAQAVLLIPSNVPPPPTTTPTATATPGAPTATPTPASVITFVGAGPLTDSSSPVATLTVSRPAGVTAGEVMIAQIVVFDASGTNMPSASGWSLIRDDSIGSAGSNQMTSWLYYRVATASEPGSYTWNLSPQYAAGVMGAWSGTSALPIDLSSGAGTSGNPAMLAAPALSPNNNGELQVYFYGSQNFKAPTISVPAPITEDANDQSALEGFTLAFGNLPAPPQGMLSPTYPATSTGSGGVVLTAQAVLLIPAP